LPIQTNNDTNILPDSFTKIPDTISVLGDDKLAILDTIRKTSEIRTALASIPCLITAESRRRKLQRFLDLPHLTIELIWFPLITYWLTTYCRVGTRLSIAIDRSQWGCINLFMVSLIWERRAIPLYWSLLPKLGSSNFDELSCKSTASFTIVFPI